MTSLLSMLDRFEQAAVTYETSTARADRDELHAARRAIMEAFDQAQKAIEALNICIEQDDKREAKLRAREAELVKALTWALPLAERALDDHRIERLRCGHHDIGAERGTDIGLWDQEVLPRDAARAALKSSLEQE